MGYMVELVLREATMHQLITLCINAGTWHQEIVQEATEDQFVLLEELQLAIHRLHTNALRDRMVVLTSFSHGPPSFPLSPKKRHHIQ